MTPELFASAALFAIAGSFTPGPNNAMLLASGVNFGFQRTIPHIAGVTIGYGVMFAAVGLGVGRFIVENPTLHGALKIASAVYLVWLAWRIATAEGEPGEEPASRPLTFLQAALFQWINPKGVAMALAAAAAYIDPRSPGEDLAILSALILVVSVASASTWALFGQGLRGFLTDGKRRRAFNTAMALALLASLWPLLA